MVYFKEIYPADLFLLRELISLGVSSLLGPDSVQALVSTSLADGLEGLELLEVVSHFHGTDPLDSRLDRHDSTSKLDRLRELLSGGIALAWLLGVKWEQDQLGLVLLQTLGVQLQGLNTLVSAAVINSNSNGLGVLLAQTCSFQLLKGPGGDARSLLNSVLAAPDLPGGLVEPSLDIALPVLVKMAVRHDVVSL